ncbi:MAG: hypothetical protein WCX65_16470 [bacterium]
MNKCSEPIQKVIDLCRQMLEAADEGDGVREDDGCGVLYGMVRDCAYKIRTIAEEEKAKHKNKGKWD